MSAPAHHRRPMIAGLVASVSATALTLLPAPAQAALPVFEPGDIISLSTTGGPGVDATDNGLVTTRVSALPSAFTLVASNPVEGVMVASPQGEIRLISPVDGSQQVIHRAFTKTGETLTELQASQSGSIVGVVSTSTGGRVVAMTVADDDSVSDVTVPGELAAPTQLNLDFNGGVLVTDGRRLVRLDETPTVVATFGGTASGLAMNPKGQLFVRVDLDGPGGQVLLRVDRVTGTSTVVASGGNLVGNAGLVMEASGAVLASERSGSVRTLVRINPLTGGQTVVRTLAATDTTDVAVASLDQAGGTPPPSATGEDLTVERTSDPAAQVKLVLKAPGVLANDRTVVDEELHASLVSPPAIGDLTFFASGEVRWIPPVGFLGSTSFTYRALGGGGRQSTPVTVTLTVLPDQQPVAEVDHLVVPAGRTIVLPAFALTSNDHDPQGDALTPRIRTAPEHGALRLAGAMLTYTPKPGFLGDDGFVYDVSDGHHVSEPTVSRFEVVDVAAPAPVVTVTGGTASASGSSATVTLRVADQDDAPEGLELAVTSSAPDLVPSTGLTLTGTGANRSLVVTPTAGRSGTAVLSVVVSDHVGPGRVLRIVVKVGGAKADKLVGTAGTDLLFGRGGKDKLVGRAGIDLLLGGSAADLLRGGKGADLFVGGAGRDRGDFKRTTGDHRVGQLVF